MLNQLFKYTSMQTTFGANMLALVDGQPRTLTLKQILQHYIAYREQVITRRTRYDLAKAEARKHILEGLTTALDNLDAVIETIRRSQNRETASNNLRTRFKLSEEQAKADPGHAARTFGRAGAPQDSGRAGRGQAHHRRPRRRFSPTSARCAR